MGHTAPFVNNFKRPMTSGIWDEAFRDLLSAVAYDLLSDDFVRGSGMFTCDA